MILLDTSLLSIAYRRRQVPGHEVPAVTHLRQMVQANAQLVIPGIVVQELLSGVRDELQFTRLQDLLERFPLLPAGRADYVAAAVLFHSCRRKGIVATLVDCQIAAQAISHGAELWTFDKDFRSIARVSDLRLCRPQLESPGV